MWEINAIMNVVFAVQDFHSYHDRFRDGTHGLSLLRYWQGQRLPLR
jgi:hypothetical protein